MDIRYFAGLMDADGHITIRRWRERTFVVSVGFTNCYKPVVDAFASKFGGTVHFMNQAVKKPHHRPTWGWVCGNKIAYSFLKEIYPHLIIKKRDAELAMLMQEHIETHKSIRSGRRGGFNLPEGTFEYRLKLHDECRDIKKVCFYPDTPKSPMRQ